MAGLVDAWIDLETVIQNDKVRKRKIPINAYMLNLETWYMCLGAQVSSSLQPHGL